jgi:flagellar biosynthesis/type III secretory pathway protein FliH
MDKWWEHKITGCRYNPDIEHISKRPSDFETKEEYEKYVKAFNEGLEVGKELTLDENYHEGYEDGWEEGFQEGEGKGN